MPQTRSYPRWWTAPPPRSASTIAGFARKAGFGQGPRRYPSYFPLGINLVIDQRYRREGRIKPVTLLAGP